MIKHLGLVCLILCSLKNHAQDGRFNLGARNTAIAGTSVTLSDGWSLFNNVAGLGNISKSVASTTYRSRYNLPELSTLGLTYIHAAKRLTSGVSFFRFGDDLFNQQRLSLGVGNRFQMVSLGLGVSAIQYHLESIGTKNVFVFEFGGVAELLPELIIGAHIFNINQAEINHLEPIPVLMKTGLSYRPISSLMINIELRKEVDQQEEIAMGMEYRIIEWVAIRTGFSSHLRSAAFGLGIDHKQFNVDYGFAAEGDIGSIHEFSLSFQTQK